MLAWREAGREQNAVAASGCENVAPDLVAAIGVHVVLPVANAVVVPPLVAPSPLHTT